MLAEPALATAAHQQLRNLALWLVCGQIAMQVERNVTAAAIGIRIFADELAA